MKRIIYLVLAILVCGIYARKLRRPRRYRYGYDGQI